MPSYREVVRKHFLRAQFEPRRESKLSPELSSFFATRIEILGMVTTVTLSKSSPRRTQHRRPADIDVFRLILLRSARLSPPSLQMGSRFTTTKSSARCMLLPLVSGPGRISFRRRAARRALSDAAFFTSSARAFPAARKLRNVAHAERRFAQQFRRPPAKRISIFSAASVRKFHDSWFGSNTLLISGVATCHRFLR